jgi:hypothetical protein
VVLVLPPQRDRERPPVRLLVQIGRKNGSPGRWDHRHQIVRGFRLLCRHRTKKRSELTNPVRIRLGLGPERLLRINRQLALWNLEGRHVVAKMYLIKGTLA